MARIRDISMALLVAIGVSSCSILGAKGLVLKGDSGTVAADDKIVNVLETVANSANSNAELGSNEDVDSTASKGIDISGQPAIKGNVANTLPIKENTIAKPTNAQSKLAGKLNGEWIIIGAGNHEIHQDDDMPYLNFEEKTSRFYASNGCNILNGDFSLVGATGISFNHVISTLMSCPDIKYTKDINAVLRDGVRVSAEIQSKGQEWYMKFKSESGNVLLTLWRHNMEILSGQWIITHIGETKIDNPEVNIFFNISDLTVHGNTGCNFFNGMILIEPQVPNSISFSQMGVTMRMCENSDIEMAMLVALEETTNYRLSHKNSLTLLDSNGDAVITAKRADVE